MSRALFDFREQMVVGDVGEKEFTIYYKDLEPKKSEKREVDFFLADGKSVELKTDTYDMSATGNYFMELYSDIDSGKIGGPWRAQQDKVFYFVYYFQKNKTFFWFETEKLMPLLESIVSKNKLKLKTIRNKGWNAQGYAVPRELLEDALLRKDIF